MCSESVQKVSSPNVSYRKIVFPRAASVGSITPPAEVDVVPRVHAASPAKTSADANASGRQAAPPCSAGTVFDLMGFLGRCSSVMTRETCECLQLETVTIRCLVDS
jgi:hypothetical protein